MIHSIANQCSDALCWGARAGFIDSVLAVTGLITLASLHALDAHAAVKLLSKNLVLLAEAIKLASQVLILSGKAMCVLFQGLLLIDGIGLVAAQLLVLAAKSFDITAAHVEVVFLLLEASFGVTNGSRKVGVAAFLSLAIFTGITIFTSKSVVVTAKGCAFS